MSINSLIKEIKDKATKATSGKWEFSLINTVPDRHAIRLPNGDVFFNGSMHKKQAEYDTEYIAVVNPDNILMLIKELENKNKNKMIKWLAKVGEKGGCTNSDMCKLCPMGDEEHKRCYGKDLEYAAELFISKYDNER